MCVSPVDGINTAQGTVHVLAQLGTTLHAVPPIPTGPPHVQFQVPKAQGLRSGMTEDVGRMNQWCSCTLHDEYPLVILRGNGKSPRIL